MRLFSRIPDRFFSVLASGNKELYVQALFVLRQAFKTELIIRREDLTAMLIDSLEDELSLADLSEEAAQEHETDTAGLSARAHLILRRLKWAGWIENEYESSSFEENITIPDYAIQTINLLYDLSQEKTREYNSYVYATYAALANASENPDYVYQALQTAFQNTSDLIDELKSLFNNIRRYYRRIPGEQDVNALLAEHFDEYQAKIVDTIYYPLKTIDSVPRFKHAILEILAGWLEDEEVQGRIIEQGIARRVFTDEAAGQEEMFRMIHYISDTYEGMEAMIDEIDSKHNEYVNASIEHIRYLMNADRGVKGNLIELLKSSGRPDISQALQEGIRAYRHQYFGRNSFYSKAKRTRKTEGPLLKLARHEEDPRIIESFLADVRKQYTNQKIDAYILKQFGSGREFSTEEIHIAQAEDFILFLLGTIRAREKSAGYTIAFLDGNIQVDGCSLPRAVFTKKEGKAHV